MKTSALALLTALLFTQPTYADPLAPGYCPQADTAEKIAEAMRASGSLDSLCEQFYKDVAESEGSSGYSNPSPCSDPQLQAARSGDRICTKWYAGKKKKNK